jgi:hypothetical protein
MDSLEVVEVIRKKFFSTDNPAKIPLLRGHDSFDAELIEGGIRVNNLGNQPFLPWIVFQEAICVLIRNGGRAKRGDAMNSKLGESGLSMDSIEGTSPRLFMVNGKGIQSLGELHL